MTNPHETRHVRCMLKENDILECFHETTTHTIACNSTLAVVQMCIHDTPVHKHHYTDAQM